MRAEFHEVDVAAKLQSIGLPGWYSPDQSIHLRLKVRNIRDHASAIWEILDQGVWNQKLAQSLADVPDDAWRAMCTSLRYPNNDYAVLDVMGWD